MTDKTDLGTVIVAGASRGIGAAVATLAGEAGYAVAVNFATGEADAEKVVDAIVAAGGRAVAIKADVAREAEIIRLFERASGSWVRSRDW
jgi:NAD(P)-dependent dehydrogenase (short-subunit alcohol dehydrogenase family)